MASVGNLSRAGKVKRSTPHVEKKEREEKTKTARARLREKYNERKNKGYFTGRMRMNAQAEL